MFLSSFSVIEVSTKYIIRNSTKNIGKKNVTNSMKNIRRKREIEGKLNEVLNECLRIIGIQI